MVFLHFTGTSSGRLESDRYFSSVIAEPENSYILFDCNEETVRYFDRQGFNSQPRPVYVFISHPHADHISGLWVFMQYLHVSRYTEPVTFHLPRSFAGVFEELAARHLIFFSRLKFVCQVFPLESGQTITIDNLDIRVVESNHLQKYESYTTNPETAFSFSITGNRSGKVVWLTMDVAGPDTIKQRCPPSPELLVVDGSHLSEPELHEIETVVQPVQMLVTHYHSAEISGHFLLARDRQMLGIQL